MDGFFNFSEKDILQEILEWLLQGRTFLFVVTVMLLDLMGSQQKCLERKQPNKYTSMSMAACPLYFLPHPKTPAHSAKSSSPLNEFSDTNSLS